MQEQGQWDGSAGKGTCANPNNLSSIPGTHMVEGENSSHKFSSDLRMHGIVPAWAASTRVA